MIGIVGYTPLMRHLNGLKGRQVYVPLTDREVEMFDGFLAHYKKTKAEFLRTLILSTLKRQAIIEKAKRPKPNTHQL